MADDVLGEKPDAVIVATGGVPDSGWLDGWEHCTTVWDILSGAVAAKDEVIVYDGTGRHQAVSCALHLAEQDRNIQFVTLDDNMGLEMEYNARVVYRKRFAEHGVRITIDHQLERVRPSGNGLVATFRHELTRELVEMRAPQIVVESGTAPITEAFEALRSRSTNNGITDIDALLDGEPQRPTPPADGAFELHRIGDAVSSRSVHAAIYDALRLCMAL